MTTVRFDRFLLDVPGRRLLRDGADVHLTPKAFELLHLLIDRRPAAVAKNAIMEALWPSTFVLEANVANLIAEIRVALGDDASRPRFVRTVPRFGYAFSGDVAASDLATVPLALPLTPVPGAGAPVPASDGGELFSTAPTPVPGSASVGDPVFALPPGVAAAPGPVVTPVTATRSTASFALLCGRERVVLRQGSTVLGREGAAAELLKSPQVSRRHARIDVHGADVYLEDLGSKNGCTIDGRPVVTRTLVPVGARIGLGSVALVLIRDDGTATQTMAMTDK